MKTLAYIGSLFALLLLLPEASLAQDSLTFKGQISAWGMYNNSNELPFYTGGRYIPQANYEVRFKNNYKIDFEASANINGIAGLRAFDSLHTDGQIKPYRLWGRFSTNQLEIRAGLQKINFGSASMLRPLMWFDQMDPRDPLNLTDGVWGVLGRYYFLNNANIWLWALYGNDESKGWEILGTKEKHPEFGGRIQLPYRIGELALSYHHRTLDTREELYLPAYEIVEENRIGFDTRIDWLFGAWIEGSWTHNNKDLSLLPDPTVSYTNQHILNAGLDYTFGIGNGILVTYEQLLASYDKTPFAFENNITFSLLSLSYPIGLFDNISGIIYYDWTNKNIYNFLNWQKSFNQLSMYVMAYWNPEDYNIPTQNAESNLFAGKGLQIMFVFNH